MKLADKLRARVSALPTNGPAIAQEWLTKGFRTTPVAPPIKGDRDSGKNPAIAGTGWWDRADSLADFNPERYQNKNVGICGGYALPDGGWLLILDPDGEQGLSELAALGELPQTLTVRSGSGVGKHYYFRTSKQFGGVKIGDHIDTRGKGGQAVAPGCYHYSGNRYEIEIDAPIAVAPAWLEALLKEPRAVKSLEDLAGLTPVVLTREMLRTKADELGRGHRHFETLDKLARGLPLGTPAARHEAADIFGTKTLVLVFGAGITDASVMTLMQPTYPKWTLDPIGPGRDAKNWNDCLKGLHGAKRQFSKELDLSTPGTGKEGFQATEKMVASATAALKKDVKFVAQDYKQLGGAAYRLGRFTPHVLDTELVKRELFKVATQQSGSGVEGFLTVTEARAAIDAGVARGQKNPMYVYTGWKSQLVIDQEKGTLVVCDENAALFLQHHPEVEGLVRQNVRKGKPFFEFAPPWQTNRTEFPCPIEDHDAVDAGRWLARQMGRPMAGAKRTLEALNTVAAKNKYDPFRTWLEGLKWDGVARLDYWLQNTCGVEDSEYHRLVGSKFVISAVARTLDPGCDAQHVLVLVGEQGLNKSRAFRELCGAEYFCSNIGDIHKEEAIFNLEKYVIVELAELAAFKKADMEIIKRFISDTSEDLRRKYARNSEEVTRRAVFGGTTNQKEFLTDPTGNRRFWPVECLTPLKLEWLAKNREQLWAEALHRKQAGETWWPTREQEKLFNQNREEYVDTDDLAERLEFFSQPFKSWPTSGDSPMFTEPEQVEVGTNRLLWATIPQVHLVLGTNIENRQDQLRVKKMCSARGWLLEQKRTGGKKHKIWRFV